MALNCFIKENVHYLSQVILLRMRQLRLPVPWSYCGGRDIWLPRETLDRECWVAEGVTKQTNKITMQIEILENQAVTNIKKFTKLNGVEV